MKQPQRFFELLNNAGQRPSRVNAMVESVRDRLTAVIDTLGDAMGRTKDSSTRETIRTQRAELDEIRTAVLNGGKENSALGDVDLKALETWGLGNDGVPPSAGLRPGQRVADVSEAEGAYTGPLDPDTLTPGQWRYWGEHNDLHARTGQIFSKAPTVMDPATGKLLTAGDYANATPDGTPFAAFE